MKTVYFLRHGQTNGNHHWTHQSPDTPLSETGREQARAAATHFCNIPFDVIISSTFDRAKSTARAVHEATNIAVEHSDLFVELRKPSVLRGTSWFSPKSLWIMGILYLLAGQPDYHHSDEENLNEFHTRTRKALEYLANRPEERILVVTHRGLMSALMESMKRDGKDTLMQYRIALWKNFKLHNGCYVQATWSPEGTNGDTLAGTWTVKNDIVCPSSNN